MDRPILPTFAPRLARSGPAALLLTAALVATGCSAAPPSMQAPNRGRVVLIRGLFNVFSLGMDELADDLDAEGYDATAIAGNQRSLTGRRLIQEHRAGTLGRPLVVVGHSYGGDAAVRLTQQLAKKGVPVDKLILVDPTTPGKVPANVAEVFNVYESSPATDWIPVIRGVAVEAKSDATRVTNFDIRRSEDARFRDPGTNHFTIDTADAVQELVLAEVRKVHGPATPATARDTPPPVPDPSLGPSPAPPAAGDEAPPRLLTTRDDDV